MDVKSSFDAFRLCWDSIFEESAKYENKFFDASFCKISDSRDTSFEIIENRLSYVYKYGYFNILFFEKCFLLFINQCSEVLFPFENLKVCSLSNGPGFDIIGLLSALCISDKPLKCLPVLNAVNVHESWSELYKSLVCKGYEMSIAKTFLEYFHLNATNINLIQGDIYSKLSPEAENCISNSNVLLMVNVYASSKAAPETFKGSLKEIFTLLQPGSLIFFIGSKNNMKLYSKFTHLSQYVKCVFGPQKVALNSLPINEHISNIIGSKPCDSGHAQFVVWQKKDQILKNTENEQQSSEEDTVECKDDTDTMSELCLSSASSFSSLIEKCDKSKSCLTLSDRFDLTSPEEIKSEILGNSPQSVSQDYTVESITSILRNIKLKEPNCEEQKFEVLQSDCSKVSNLISEIPKENNHSSQESSVSLMRDNQVLDKTFQKNKINLKVEADSASGTISNKNCLVNQTVNDQSTSSPKKSKKSKKQPQNKIDGQSLDGNSKKDNCENTINLKVVEADFASGTISNKNSLVNLTVNDKSTSSPKKSKKSKAQSLNKIDGQSLDGNTKKDSCENTKMSLQKNSLLNSTCKNSVKIESKVTNQGTNSEDINNTHSNVQSLLQRCESLISKLEEITTDITNEFKPSRNVPVFNKTQFCNQQIGNCIPYHHCCCVKIVHSCCCRKVYKH